LAKLAVGNPILPPHAEPQPSVERPQPYGRRLDLAALHPALTVGGSYVEEIEGVAVFMARRETLGDGANVRLACRRLVDV